MHGFAVSSAYQTSAVNGRTGGGGILLEECYTTTHYDNNHTTVSRGNNYNKRQLTSSPDILVYQQRAKRLYAGRLPLSSLSKSASQPKQVDSYLLHHCSLARSGRRIF